MSPIETKETRSFFSQLYWPNVLFLTLTPLVALVGGPLYLMKEGFSWPIFLLFTFYLLATGLSITAGYHRLFSHKSYEANGLIRFLLLAFGGASCQNSALKWSSEHRDHHRYVDQADDPYNIHKGFFYAHIGWVLLKDPKLTFENVRDLQEDKLILWQHRNYWMIAVVLGFVVPFLAGVAFGRPWGALLWAGIVRTVLVHHSTFLINSLCHFLGKQPYSLRNTSRDNGLTALLTFGEGYHNFHHKFQYDYRNGIRWYQWDPTKWVIRGLEMIRFVKKLRRASDEIIFQAKIEVEREKLLQKMDKFSIKLPEALVQKLNHAQEKLLAARMRWDRMKKEYQEVKDSIGIRRVEILEKLTADLHSSRNHLQEAYAGWKETLQEYYRKYAKPSGYPV